MTGPGPLRKKWTSGRSALVVIALLFAASALVRLGAGSGQAIAQEIAALKERQPDPATAAAEQTCTNPEEIEQLLSEISERQAGLQERKSELDEFEQTLKFSQQQITARLEELEAAEARLSALLSISENAAEEDLARLTAVYENMKPKQAAKLFEQMVPEFAAGFVGRMRADAAAQILAALPAEAAYSISVVLAGRNANAPTE